MNYIFEPKLDMPVGAVAPDEYKPASGREPPDDFVISRHRDGSTASTYGELTWNLSVYQPEGQPSILNFSHWDVGSVTPAREKLSREARYLLFLLMWVREGSSLSIGTLRNYLAVVRAMAQFAEDESCQLRDLLEEEKRMWSFVEAKCSGWMTQTLGSLLPQLAYLGRDHLGFDLVGDKVLQELRTRGLKYRSTLNQHPPIPTRIYSTIITQLLKELSEWEAVADNMLLLVKTCATDPRMGRSIDHQRSISNKLGIPHQRFPSFDQLATKDCLDYFEANGLSHNVKSLASHIGNIQLVAKLTIQTFTGMREDEALSLPYHCLDSIVANGNTHYIVLGRTTKLNKGRVKRTRWATNKDGFLAIRLAKQIADAIYATVGDEPKKTTTRTNYYPLLVSTLYLEFSGSVKNKTDDLFLAGQSKLDQKIDLRGET